MGGIGIALMLDRFDNTLKSREDVEERLGIPVLGELMLLKGKRADGAPFVPAMEFLDEPTSSFAEAIRTIRTGVALSGLDQSQQTLVVTSTVSGEGKSTVALNLALALGQLGNVLLIDADLRRPALAKLFGLDSQHTGPDRPGGRHGQGEGMHPHRARRHPCSVRRQHGPARSTQDPVLGAVRAGAGKRRPPPTTRS